MRQDDEEEVRADILPDAPLPNRLGKGTLLGCLGIACVLALPATLLLPMETWRVPLWITHLVPLLAVALAVGGAWLLVQVPAGSPARSTDPLHPLTEKGRLPVEEHPARAENRAGLVAALLLGLGAIAGYLAVSFGNARRDTLIGTLLAGGAGCALIAYGLLAVARRLPVPAWQWLRLPIAGGPVLQALPLGFAGLIALVWALVVAAGEGYVWAPIGVGGLILGAVLIGPLLQRVPPARGSRTRDGRT